MLNAGRARDSHQHSLAHIARLAVASVLFILNAIVVQIDWFLRGRFTLVGRKRSLFSWNYRLVDWYFWSNIFFWLGAFGDQITSIYYLWEEHWLETNELPEDQPFITNLLACYFWTISGMYGAMIWYCDRIDRIAYKTKHRFAMFGPLGDSPAGYRNLFDYRGWGDWCFWPGAILYTISAHGCLRAAGAVQFVDLVQPARHRRRDRLSAQLAHVLSGPLSQACASRVVRARAHPRRQGRGAEHAAGGAWRTWRSNTTTSLSKAIQSFTQQQHAQQAAW
jgi:hypothetical protein